MENNSNYIDRLNKELAELKPYGEFLLEAERKLYNKPCTLLDIVRKESDYTFKRIREIEESLGIAQTLERINALTNA